MRTWLQDDVVRSWFIGDGTYAIADRLSRQTNQYVDQALAKHGRCLVFIDATALTNINWTFAGRLATGTVPYLGKNVHWIAITPTGWLLGFAIMVTKQFGLDFKLCTSREEALAAAAELGFEVLEDEPVVGV